MPSGVISPLSAECSKRTTKFVLDTHRYTNQVGQRCCGWHSPLKRADRHRWTEQSHLLFSICFFMIWRVLFLLWGTPLSISPNYE